MDRTTGRVSSGGEDIYYEVLGGAGEAAETVVLTHGLGGNRASWWRQVVPFAPRWKVVLWDQRGFGNSTRRSGEVGPEPAVDDLRALLDHLSIERAHVVGQSMGGWVVMGFALRHPHRVRSVVLADSPGGLLTDEVRTAAGAARSRLRLGEGFGRHPALGDRYIDAEPDEAALYDLLSTFGDKVPDEEMIGLLTACRWSTEDAARLLIPVLFVCGEEDPMAPPEGLRSLARLLPDARLEVIDGCGHSPYLEAPARWNAVVGSFLEERAGDGA